MKKILILGACGQIGTDLTLELRNRFGEKNVIASDIYSKNEGFLKDGIFEIIDVLDKKKISEVIDKYQITEIYHLAAVLSGNAEKNPMKSWEVNMTGLFNILELGIEKNLNKIFWPSSIAIFGPNTPRENTPQDTITDPNTVYGISKLAGERWIEYYNNKYNLDIRSLRYPGLISYKAEAGGGTTDYAVEIFYEAVRNGKYECFLSKNTKLPMMYMDDAINATIELMELDKENLSIKTSYNLSSMSFTPYEIAKEIKKHIPNFEITYYPDFRQKIADSWPKSIDDSLARKNGGWKHKYNLSEMTEIMLKEIAKKLN